MSIRAMYPGTFDPMTNGHSDLIRRASRMFEHVVVAIASNPKKKPLFTLEERVEMARKILAPYNNVTIAGYDTLTISFAREHNLNVIMRGLRAVTDFEFEFQLASMNRELDEDIETIFLTPDEKFSYISSSMVREISALSGDVSKFVDSIVVDALQERYSGT